MDQYYTVFNYINPIPQKDVKYQDRKIVSGPGVKPAPKFVLPGHSKENFGKEPPPYALIMDILENNLSDTVDKSSGNASGSIVGSFIKHRSSTIFQQLEYSMDGTGP